MFARLQNLFAVLPMVEVDVGGPPLFAARESRRRSSSQISHVLASCVLAGSDCGVVRCAIQF